MHHQELGGYLGGDFVAYEKGTYSTYFMEDYERENQLIFKLQQRKLSKFRMLAEHVISQIDPGWKIKSNDHNSTLRSKLESCFKITRDCRLSNDITYFRINCDKKFEIQVQAIQNLSTLGKRA